MITRIASWQRGAMTKHAAAVAAFACGAVLALPLVFENGPAHASTLPASHVAAATSAIAADMTSTRVTFHSTLPTSEIHDDVAADVSAAPAAVPADVPSFNGRPVRAVRTIRMTVTAYSPDERSCGDSADGITASGYSVLTNGGRMVAADTSILPLGSMIAVPGYDAGEVVPVLDRGGAIKGNRLDVLFATHEEAIQWGVKTLDVTVYEYADGKPNDFRERHWKR
ncbi:MAG: 3D domain-containing protein [Phycisphaerae bacterium]|nr:3D domain-containing protein [Phycisphaerae bacterium]